MGSQHESGHERVGLVGIISGIRHVDRIVAEDLPRASMESVAAFLNSGMISPFNFFNIVDEARTRHALPSIYVTVEEDVRTDGQSYAIGGDPQVLRLTFWDGMPVVGAYGLIDDDPTMDILSPRRVLKTLCMAAESKGVYNNLRRVDANLMYACVRGKEDGIVPLEIAASFAGGQPPLLRVYEIPFKTSTF